MLDCELMVKVVNHLRKTEQFQKTEEKFLKHDKRYSHLMRNMLLGMGGGMGACVLGMQIPDFLNMTDENAIATTMIMSAAVGISGAMGPLSYSMIQGTKRVQTVIKLEEMIRDCYLQESSVQEKMNRGIDELSAREKTKAEFEAMPDYIRELKNNEFCKDVKKYEIDYSRQFDYRTFIVEEDNVDESSNDLINCEILDTQVVDSEFEGENLEITEQTQETEPTM